MSDRDRQPAELGAGISRPLVMLLALTCGAAVANLYYAQPLLHTIARALSVSNGTAGLLVTFTQAGYVVGLALLVPLGDLHERRALITAMLVIAAAGLGLAAAAPSFTVFALALAVLGVMAVVAQIVVAMSSSLAGEHERRVVGTVMSGLLIGPHGPHHQRHRRRAVRMARDLRRRGRRDGAARRRPAPDVSAHPHDRAAELPGAAALGRPACPR